MDALTALAAGGGHHLGQPAMGSSGDDRGALYVVGIASIVSPAAPKWVRSLKEQFVILRRTGTATVMALRFRGLPWPRNPTSARNVNASELIRELKPKEIEFVGHQPYIGAIADVLNINPSSSLGYTHYVASRQVYQYSLTGGHVNICKRFYKNT